MNSLVVDSIGVGLAAFGFLNLLLAAFIHVSSEMAFILNSARLLPRVSSANQFCSRDSFRGAFRNELVEKCRHRRLDLQLLADGMSLWIKDAGKLLPLESSIATLYTHTVVLFSWLLLRFFALLYETVAKEADGLRVRQSSYMPQRTTIRLRPRAGSDCTSGLGNLRVARTRRSAGPTR
jgi:hypothetical protein